MSNVIVNGTDLSHFELRVADDPIKTDLELVCVDCGEHVCDAQHGDTLAILAEVVSTHEHRTAVDD